MVDCFVIKLLSQLILNSILKQKVGTLLWEVVVWNVSVLQAETVDFLSGLLLCEGNKTEG